MKNKIVYKLFIKAMEDMIFFSRSHANSIRMTLTLNFVQHPLENIMTFLFSYKIQIINEGHKVAFWQHLVIGT